MIYGQQPSLNSVSEYRRDGGRVGGGGTGTDVKPFSTQMAGMNSLGHSTYRGRKGCRFVMLVCTNIILLYKYYIFDQGR